MQLIDAASVETAPFDLFHIRCFHEPAAAMPVPHRHDDLEVVLVAGTEAVYYEHLGRQVPLLPGRATAFWAAYPHTLAKRSSGAVLQRLMVPIGLLLSRGLPEPLVVGLMSGHILSAAVDTTGVQAKFRQWELDAASGIAEARKAMLLEIDGWLRRISAELSDSATGPGPGRSRIGPSAHSTAVVASMCRYIVRHFHEPIRVADVASAARVAPQYGMTLFHSVTGLPVAEYLNRCRVAEAQRLLVASEANVSTVAFAAGFGSVSQFYDRFTSSCGTTPRQFRLDSRS
jgi:AraC-like DNA-binding protein